MQQRTLLTGIGLVGVGALVITQMGFGAQDRQYKKTLQYMHDGRDKIEKRMDQMKESVKDTVSGSKK